MAVGSPGASASAGGSSTAITRLNTIDPHLVLMMRDVMEGTDNATRLKVSGGA